MIGSRRFDFCLEYSLFTYNRTFIYGIPTNGHHCMNMNNLENILPFTGENVFIPLDFKLFNINRYEDEFNIFSGISISPIPHNNTYNVSYSPIVINCFNDLFKVFSEVLRINCKNDNWDEQINGLNNHIRSRDFWLYRNIDVFCSRYLNISGNNYDVTEFNVRIKKCLF